MVAILLAALLVSLTFAGVYYGQYSQSSAQSGAYAKELDVALANYNSLAGRYNASLIDDNATLSLLATAVANMNTSTAIYRNASVDLASLWSSYQELAASGGKALTYQVHMLVDYGNGTKTWYNDTRVQPGWNGYIVTLVLLNGSVDALWYPQYGEHLVTGIGGVNDTQSETWFVITYSRAASWQAAQVGVDDIPMGNGTVFAWAFCAENSSYGPACPLP